MSKKINWAEVVIGVAIASATTADVIPGDEVLGVPLGAFVVAHGLRII